MQVELIKELKRIAYDSDLQVLDIGMWLGYTKTFLYRASKGEVKLPEEDIRKIKEKIKYFEETGIFKIVDRPRQKIDYELLHAIDKDYMNHLGTWDEKAYDDPRLKYVLYYEDVE